LPYRVEPNQVKANFENGVLTVTMRKNKVRQQARKIPVHGEAQQKQVLNTAREEGAT
jgi:hypothetical protein